MTFKLIQAIKEHEGYRMFPYRCTANKLTIGYGFNLEDVGISEEESELILKLRLQKLHNKLNELDWYAKQNQDRKDALLDMAYNLGFSGLLKFKKMIAALKINDYKSAAVEALNSKWAAQVGRRANKIAHILETGAF